MSNNTKYVRDAFKSLELVEDKEFDLFGKDSFEELGDFIADNDDVEVEKEVIDLDAQEPEELKDSYVGDAILSCPVCHTNLFKEISDIVIDEETELCCVGDPCPICGQEDGFKVIGKVAPFKEEEETEVEVETEPEEAEVEVKEKVKESKKAAKRNKLSEKLSKRVLKNKVNESLKKPTKGKKLSEAVSDYAKEDIKREIERIVDEYFKGTDFFVSVSNIDFDAGKVTLDISALGGYDEDSDEVEELNREVEFDIPNLDLEDYFAAQLEDWMNTHNSPDNFYESKKLTEAPIYDLNPQFDSRKSFYSKAKVDTGDKGDKNKLYSYNTLVAELKDGKPVVYGTYSSTTLRHIKDWLKQLGFKAENAKQIMADYGVKDENRSVRRPGRKVNESLEDIKSEWENMRRENIFEFPSGDYVYVGIDFDKKTIYAGGATNTGIFRDTEIDLDEDDSLYGNLERLYDTISEEHPEYFETDESLKEDIVKQDGKWVNKGEEGTHGKFPTKKKAREQQKAMFANGYKAKGESLEEGWYRGAKGIKFISHGNWSDPELEYKGHTFNYWDIEDALWNDFLETTGHTDSESNDPLVETEFDDYVQSHAADYLEDVIAFSESKEPEKKCAVTEETLKQHREKKLAEKKEVCPDCGKEICECDKKEEQLTEEYEVGVKIPKKYLLTNGYTEEEIKELPSVLWDKYTVNVKIEPNDIIITDDHHGYNVSYFMHYSDLAKFAKEISESLTEDIEKATIETEDQVIEVKAEEKEEAQEEVSEEEMIVPLDAEDIEEIDAVQEEPEEEVEETEEGIPEEEEEFEFDEIQEESFKRITETYLKNVYSNVKSFNIDGAELKESLLTVNGTIEFNSGKTKKTSFVFESKNDNSTIAKNKIRFVGLNETFTDKKNAYVLKTSLDGKKLVAESLRYEYPAKAKNLTESVKIVKGFVK